MLQNLLKKVAQSVLANVECPQCGAAYGSGIELKGTSGSPEVTCPHCGFVNRSPVMTSKPGAAEAPGTDPSQPPPQPANPKALAVDLPDGGVAFEFPPSSNANFLRIFSMIVPVTSVFPLALIWFMLGKQTDVLVLGVMTVFVLGGSIAAGWVLKKAARRAASTFRLKVSGAEAELQQFETSSALSTDRPDWTRSLAIGDVKIVRQYRASSSSSNTSSLWRIEMTPAPGTGKPLRFGDSLDRAERTWIVWKLRETLRRLGNEVV